MKFFPLHNTQLAFVVVAIVASIVQGQRQNHHHTQQQQQRYVQQQSNETTDTLCISKTGNYTVVLDVYTSQLGYYTFKECPGMVNPTIGIEYGVTYTFVQADRTNWYHPMGFAYFPDGAHDNVDELEPTISKSPTNTSCIETSSCPTPRYFRDNMFLGKPMDPEDFGLDVYEPEFTRSIVDWSGAGEYTIQLTFDDETYTKDIFYFCHIHQYMTGRIKLLKNGAVVSEAYEPVLGYEYQTQSEFDKKCGSWDLEKYQLPNLECPETFVCLDDSIVDENLITYAQCIDAMNCHMVSGMTTQYSASSPVALFIHQMIPHHENAINMAKVLLHQNTLKCDDLTQQDDPDCLMEAILRDIVVTQNFQIQGMRTVLEKNNFEESADCMVPILALSDTDMDTTKNDTNDSNNNTSTSEATRSTFAAVLRIGSIVLMMMMMSSTIVA